MPFDVAVVGGGGAGLAAAVSAARAGARTLVVERHGALGGMATASLVHSVCGLYCLRAAPGAVYANPGFASEVAERLLADDGAVGPVRMGRVDVLLHHPPALAALADRLVGAEPAIELRLHSEVIAAEVGAGGAVLEICCRGRRQTVEARVLVDASGDATAAALAGATFEVEAPERLQRPAFVFALGGVADGTLAGEQRLRIAHRLSRAVRAGSLTPAALGASLREIGRPGEAYVTIDLAGLPDAPYDPLDPRCLTALEVHGRDAATEIARFLRREADGFARSFIAAFPARVGVRESRRVVGELRLGAEDLDRGARFPDAVALATWPIEMRETATGARLRFPSSEEPCEIPLRALRALGHPRLLVAGRCLAASHEAQASIRVIGTCLATGEAAGLAAALLASDDHERAAVAAKVDAAAAPDASDAEGVATALAGRVCALREAIRRVPGAERAEGVA